MMPIVIPTLVNGAHTYTQYCSIELYVMIYFFTLPQPNFYSIKNYWKIKKYILKLQLSNFQSRELLILHTGRLLINL